MKVSAPTRDRVLGALVVLAALVYLAGFISRGWVPHDEGMLGQSADRVLHGSVPHVDYEEPYTGALSWLYAATFRIAGVDLLHVRRLLFVAACGAAWLMYAILRRHLKPIAAAVATWVAVAWSFPNYFAGLPSWWLLVCALVCLWAMMRYAETSNWRYIALAGVAAGVALTIKQTGVYLLVALVLWMLYDGLASDSSSHSAALAERGLRWATALLAIVFAAVILAPRIFGMEGLYLFVPAAACALVLLIPIAAAQPSIDPRSRLVRVIVGTTAAAVPMFFLVAPYIRRYQLWDFVYGAIVLPHRRLAFASMPMPGVSALAVAAPLTALAFGAGRASLASRSPMVNALAWPVAIALPIAALQSATAYQIVWQSSRALAVVVPLAICWRLARGQVATAGRRSALFASAATMAWMALNQFPFSAPIYFCYLAPLVVIAATAAATELSVRPATLLPWAVMLLLFALLSTNRQSIHTLGLAYVHEPFDAPLALPRAHLKVNEEDARTYRGLVQSIGVHLRGGQLIAGPDCPEVYFLTGMINPSGLLFDFFSSDETDWSKAEVVVLNHMPQFTPALPTPLVERLRHEFPGSEEIGRFEIRWR